MRVFLVLLLVALTVGGCRTPSSGPYQPAASEARDGAKAQDLTQRAARLIETDSVQAEALLREALTCDVFHGPAHNNLGVLYLAQGKLYEAASEFEWARKLMPGHPDPRLNLGLTLERAARPQEALEAFATSLEVMPEHMPAIEAIARLQRLHGLEDARTRPFLEQIALRGETEAWRIWAQDELRRLHERDE